MVELVGAGSVINGAYPSSFVYDSTFVATVETYCNEKGWLNKIKDYL